MSYEPKKIVHGFNIRENLNLNVNFKYNDECISPSSLTLALHNLDPSNTSVSSISPVSSVDSLNTYGTYDNYDTYDTCKSAPICIPKKHKK